MKKEQIITVSYLLVSVGLFLLAIDLWICGSQPYCRENNRLISSIANATISVNVPTSFTDSSGKSWSGPSDPDFSINFSGSTAPITIPSDGDDADGDGH